ncbi:hypothetical protein E0W80_01905 [Microbacterium sp. PI-1]|uniref:hypothetical protein n=1 Tax=Microbacterium sp. PI-1 TaxID=2545631 RepID=UPI001040B7E2|nr:hypothetical protein [Microbacterium sp. PI-1]TCJ29008.1 hypothetical protein E0W80_01905 [Microbacterium sp. PI-1]
MIRPSIDPERIRAALGIPARPRGNVEDALAALAALAKKREALGIETPSPYPPDATPEERRSLATATLAELVSTVRPSPWGIDWR